MNCLICAQMETEVRKAPFIKVIRQKKAAICLCSLICTVLLQFCNLSLSCFFMHCCPWDCFLMWCPPTCFLCRYCFPFGRPDGALKATLSLLERVREHSEVLLPFNVSRFRIPPWIYSQLPNISLRVYSRSRAPVV